LGRVFPVAIEPVPTISPPQAKQGRVIGPSAQRVVVSVVIVRISLEGFGGLLTRSRSDWISCPVTLCSSSPLLVSALAVRLLSGFRFHPGVSLSGWPFSHVAFFGVSRYRRAVFNLICLLYIGGIPSSIPYSYLYLWI
jgi:hypothetical protein